MLKELKNGADVGSTFKRGLDVYKKNFVPLLLATVLAIVIGGVSCGICAAPLFCGVFAMILAAMRSEGTKLKAGDVFNGFQKFLPAFVSCIVLGIINSIACTILLIIPIVGWIAYIVVACAIAPAVVAWSQLLVIDQDASIGDAITVPLKLIGDKRFWSIILVAFVAGLIGGLGAIVCGIGLFVTIPFAYCMIAAAYEQAYSDDAGETPALESAAEPSIS